jgi:hypothetical protein
MSDKKKEASGAKTAAERMEAMNARKRAAGLVSRQKWAHPDDWPDIDAFIEAVNARRQKI